MPMLPLSATAQRMSRAKSVERSASEGMRCRASHCGEELAEDDECGGEDEGHQRERNEEECAETALPEGPAVDGEGRWRGERLPSGWRGRWRLR